jgi:hypothetical protein
MVTSFKPVATGQEDVVWSDRACRAAPSIQRVSEAIAPSVRVAGSLFLGGLTGLG